jgi:Cytochrome P450
VDLAQELAWPTPNEVFFDLLGLPAARAQGREQLNRWVHELKDRKPDDSRLTPVAKAATAGIQAYFMDLLHERRARPRTDLVTHMVTAEIDGVPFAEEDFGPASEVLGLMMVLFLGGVESTAGLSGRCSSCSPRTRTSAPSCGRTRRSSRTPSRRRSGSRRPCNWSAERPRATSPCTASRSRPAAGWCWSTARRTATSGGSPTRTASM